MFKNSTMKEIMELFRSNLRTTKSYDSGSSAKKTCPISNWKLPINNNFDCELSRLEQTRIRRANKYLNYMLKKMWNMSMEGKTREVWILGDILLRRSTAFKTLCVHKGVKGWVHKISFVKLLKACNEFEKFSKFKSTKLDVLRFYIEKKNGTWRPIGSPQPSSKMILTGIELILRVILEPRIGEYQHGFRPKRSCRTALLTLVSLINENKAKEVYEFDLSGFFNSINVQAICGRLNNLSKGLGKWIQGITFDTNPKFDLYKPEKEIEEIIAENGRKLYRKRGFTQGAPIAPLMSIWSMEFAEFSKIENLVMYADDGVIVGDFDMENKLNHPKSRLAGIELAKNKFYGKTNKFTFLGFEFDLEKGTIIGKKGRGKLDDSENKLIKLFEYAGYEKDVRKFWLWSPVSGSLFYKEMEKGFMFSRFLLLKMSKVMVALIVRWYGREYFTSKDVFACFIQKWINKIVNKESPYLSTKGTLLLLDHFRNSKKRLITGKRGQDYKNKDNLERWTDIQLENGKIFIRYPHNWGTLNMDEKFANLVREASNLK